MDPNTLLMKLLTLADLVADNPATAEESELAQGLLDLDEWIRPGGFLPTRWTRPEYQFDPETLGWDS